MFAPGFLARDSPRAPLSTDDDRLDANGPGNEASSEANTVEPPTKRRRMMMMQTMGHQLREVGTGQQLSAQGYAEDSLISLNGNRSSKYFMRNVRNALNTRQNHKTVHIQTPESDVAPGDDDGDDQVQSKSTKSTAQYLWRPNEVSAGNPATPAVPFTFDNLITWTRCYFDNWHAAYPFVDAPSMLEYFRRLVGTGVADFHPDDSFHLTILRAMVSISIHDNRQSDTLISPPPPANLAFFSFGDAISAVSQTLIHEPSLLSLQAILSVQLFLVTMLRYNAASRLGGVAVRVAYQLGLQRCPFQVYGVGHEDSRMRQRVFWSLYLLDRQICPRLGLPLAINDDHVDVCHPGSEKHQKRRDSPPQDRDRRLDLLVFLARNAEIRGAIMGLRNRANLHTVRALDPTAVDINTALTKWWNEVEEHLESSGLESVPLSSSHRTVLTLLRHESIIALNRSILANSTSLSAYNAALQSCIGAARSVINTLSSSLQSGSPFFWPSFTWAVWMSAFIMVHAANEEQLSKDVAIRFVERSMVILKHLSLRGSGWPDACLAAITGLKKELVEARNQSKISETKRQAESLPAGRTRVRAARSNHETTLDGNAGQSRPAKPTGQDRQFEYPTVNTHGGNNNVAQQTPNVQDGFEQHVPSDLESSWLGPNRPKHQPYTFSSQSAESTSYFNDPNVQTWEMAATNSLPRLPIVNDLGQQIDGQTQSLGYAANGGRAMNDLFDGSDIPFWLGDDQIMELGLDYLS